MSLEGSKVITLLEKLGISAIGASSVEFFPQGKIVREMMPQIRDVFQVTDALEEFLGRSIHEVQSVRIDSQTVELVSVEGETTFIDLEEL